jgi:glycosyltransferase involved in cell wall biosynthesis
MSVRDRNLLRETTDFHANQAIERKLEEIFKEQPFDLIYERYSLFGLGGLHFARRRGIPHLLEVNAPLVPEASRYRNLVQKELASAVEGFLFCTTGHIVAVSSPLKEYVRSIAAKTPITVVPNGVDLERFEVEADAPDAHPRKVPATGDFVVGFVGSVRPWHGVDILLEAVGELGRSDSGFRLCVVGEGGALQPGLERRARKLGIGDRTTFTGPVPFEQIPEFARTMDVLVAPYPALDDFYFSPLKIFEYMASGRPIVASAIGQIREILTHEETALLVTPGDREELKRALLRLRRDPLLAAKLAGAARAEARAKHGWDRRIADIGTIFANLKLPTREGVGHAA